MRIRKLSDLSSARQAALGAAQRGFTLIELIMVMVILGVLSAVAGPKIFNVSVFNARGFHDQTLAYLRFAQKTAVTQRRTVCVQFGTNTVTLTIAAAVASTNCATPGALTVPMGTAGVLNAKPGVTFDVALPPTDFNFDSLGQPITSTGTAQAKQQFQVNGSANFIYVETVTGYVHE
jgi:MSHA pilin protein MshC